jgi:hypothetical protein
LNSTQQSAHWRVAVHGLSSCDALLFFCSAIMMMRMMMMMMMIPFFCFCNFALVKDACGSLCLARDDAVADADADTQSSRVLGQRPFPQRLRPPLGSGLFLSDHNGRLILRLFRSSLFSFPLFPFPSSLLPFLPFSLSPFLPFPFRLFLRSA